jgi:hypothetical protein
VKAPRWTEEDYVRYKEKRLADENKHLSRVSPVSEPAKQGVALVEKLQVGERHRVSDKNIVVVFKRLYAHPCRAFDAGDNLEYSFKRLRDSVTRMCGCRSDRSEDGIQFFYEQKKDKENSIIIEIYEENDC